MTSEIVIMNRMAIAMAADSAVTLSGYSSDKIFPSAQKLFALSDEAPVGIMVYGNASFMGVPWETIIKVYRSQRNNGLHDELDDYANDFIDFLDGNDMLFSEDTQDDTFIENLYGYLNYIKEELLASIQKIVHSDQKLVYDDELIPLISAILDDQCEEWANARTSPSFPDDFNDMLYSRYEENVDTIISEVFEEFPLNDDNIEKMKTIIPSVFSKFPRNITNTSYSGIVIAGFGEDEIFPSFKSYFIECMVCNKLKYEMDKQQSISSKTGSVISPFAQREMVDIFMRGLDPSIFDFNVSFLEAAFSEFVQVLIDDGCADGSPEKSSVYSDYIKKIVEGYVSRMEQIQRENYVSPITNVVSMLPKDELASMAESLINLTSFKRKISLDSETVGGPIDVAVISKGDGLIWIKRKHYFKSELNPQYFISKYKGAYDDGN